MLLELDAYELAGVIVATFAAGALLGLAIHRVERWWSRRRRWRR
jgi:hypothetical protein